MRTFFADSFYFIALFNPRDRWHAAATSYSKSGRYRLVTSWWVLAEVGDAMAHSPGTRWNFTELVRDLEGSAQVTIEPFSDGLLRLALDLYARRPDKGWSLTDCTSFVVIERDGLTDALTGDRHFTQAGFVALLAP